MNKKKSTLILNENGCQKQQQLQNNAMHFTESDFPKEFI